MRIAYVAPFQGIQLLRRRPTTMNLALAGNLKIELIAEMLARGGHDVEVFSQGEVVENSGRYFPAFEEIIAGERKIPVFYSSALPIRFVNGYWSAQGLLSIFRNRHGVRSFDAVIIYNLKVAQVSVALYAADKLGLPVIVEFEDDSFVDIAGRPSTAGIKAKWQRSRELTVLTQAAASICVSPHLQTRFPPGKPSLLLRGVISEQITACAQRSPVEQRRNIVAFSGTFTSTKGLVPLIEAWKTLHLPGWELHIAGDGAIAADLHRRAQGVTSIKFRGLLDRYQNAAFLAESRIGINPHDLSTTPGNVFAFKITEYLAAGLHVISTPMGPLEAALEAGMTYIEDNSIDQVAKGLNDVIQGHRYDRVADDAAVRLYGDDAVTKALDGLVRSVARRNSSEDRIIA